MSSTTRPPEYTTVSLCASPFLYVAIEGRGDEEDEGYRGEHKRSEAREKRSLSMLVMVRPLSEPNSLPLTTTMRTVRGRTRPNLCFGGLKEDERFALISGTCLATKGVVAANVAASRRRTELLMPEAPCANAATGTGLRC
ncbi:hypothetical protein TRVL_08623 [Trypanosoma vivax]|nr:hypothetical protein TRVL_08623 [Trypanosoma vivax]